MSTAHHETADREEAVPTASNRSVGLVLGITFGLIGAWPMLADAAPRSWALALAAVLILLALTLPRTLTPVAWLWLGLGRVLHVVVSPIIMAAVYGVAVIPTGIYVRLSGKDPLRLKYDPGAQTYWVTRDPPGPDPKSLPQQF